jgi:Tfp pilus assembly protein PilZ
MNKLVSGGELRPEQVYEWFDLVEDRTINKDVSELKTTDKVPDSKDIRSLLIEEVNRMSDVEIRQFYKGIQKRQPDTLRKHDRKNFFMIIDYNVNHRYHRDFIQDISESGVFIKTSQTFSTGQKIQMTFMSPDYQKPFKIKGEIVRIHTDGVGVKFTTESQVQEAALKSFMSNIQRETVGTQ